jgi:hypothetical protein
VRASASGIVNGFRLPAPGSVELMAELAVQIQFGQVEDESQREDQKRLATASGSRWNSRRRWR